MSELPARKRPLQAVRRLDHDAVDIRLDVSLLDYGRVSKGAGLTSEEAVSRLRRLVDDGTDRPVRPRLRLPQISARTISMVAAAVVIVLGLVWLGMNLVSGSPTDSRDPQPAPVGAATVPIGAGGFAEIFVAAFLGQAGEGEESALDPFLTEPVELLGLIPGRLYVQNVAAVGVDQTDSGWSVAVAAQVLRRIDGGYGDSVLQYYRVDVLEGDRLQSSGLPTQIAHP